MPVCDSLTSTTFPSGKRVISCQAVGLFAYDNHQGLVIGRAGGSSEFAEASPPA